MKTIHIKLHNGKWAVFCRAPFGSVRGLGKAWDWAAQRNFIEGR